MKNKIKCYFAFFLCISLTAVSYACSVTLKDKINGGRCVDVGQYHLYARIYGKSEPIVIFDSGSGDDSTVWDAVVPEVSKFSRVVVYDRAGLGKSDPKPGNDRISSNDSVEGLKALLKNENIKPPYILVGHSRGGLNMQLFAEKYPHDVAGVVLIDSVSRNQTSHDPDPPKSSNYYREAISFDESREQVKKAGKFPAVPLIVLTATKQHDDANREILWRKWQREITQLSPEGKQIFAWDSGHYIQKQQPQLVISAIYTVIQASHGEK
ncbi:MAG TPA: alpha/beta hydrolase [Gammaproteobacteria bacterium]|nr:alpha/beta hydrolase [Gammaproteobacteria bacterium]